MGYLKKEFLVDVNHQKLMQRRIPLSTLIQSIQRNNISTPAGSINQRGGGETSEILIRTESQLKNKEDLLNLTLLTNDAGFETRLKDVAEVHETLAEPTVLHRADQKDSIVFKVIKKASGDTLKLVSQVKERALAFKETLNETLGQNVGQKVDITFSNDFSMYLKRRLNTLTWSLSLGLFLVVFVLIFFLPWQATLVVSVGIPIALFATLITIFTFNLSLNVVSLLGLIIVLGMLVDDAIVVCENIWRHVENGQDKTQAVIDGAHEVFQPIVASILTTISAFGPMLFMTGIFGAFVFEIPLMVILALIYSLLEAFFIMPAHFISWVNPFLKDTHLPTKRKRKKTWFDHLRNKYTNYVQWSLRFRYGLLFLAVALMAMTTLILMRSGNFVLFPKGGAEFFFVSAETSPDTPWKRC